METLDVASLHEALVDGLVAAGCIRTPEVEAAFRAVPRHLFLPGVALDRVYRDEAIPTKWENGQPVSSSSQPAIMAVMLEQLELRPGHRVLEIGAGTGYNAALLARLVGESGEVVTIDIDEEIVAEALCHLATAGADRVRVVCADGGLGFPDAAPYDRIVLTVGAWDISPAWWEQLGADGRLLLPLWVRGAQKCVAFEQEGQHWVSRTVNSCGFMRLRGAFAGPEAYVQLGPDATLSISVEDRSQVDADALYDLLNGPWRDVPAGVTVTRGEIWEGLALWLALRDPGYCTLTSEENGGARADDLPFLFRYSDTTRATDGLLGPSSACFLAADTHDGSAVSRPAAIRLAVRCYGDDDALARRLIAQIGAWDAAGRPTDATLQISAYPKAGLDTPPPDAVVVDKRWNRLAFAWK